MIAPDVILPNATLGLLGGGQLGRMFIVAARTMGYQVTVLDPDPDSPAAQLANTHIQAAYTDQAALDKLVAGCAAITTEFENVPATALEYLAKFLPVRPSGAVVAITQDRIREKNFLQSNGFKTARFAIIENPQQVATAVQHTGLPALLKLNRFGYDGKGQKMVHTLREAQQAYHDFGAQPAVLEELVAIKMEISIIIVRSADGSMAAYPPSENVHRNGILDIGIVPARISSALAEVATQVARSIADMLRYCGVMAVEFFLTQAGELLVNEIAPRPHNSGHYTLDACTTSQFEQQVRSLCGLPLGEVAVCQPSVMVNILGDLWHEKNMPDWTKVLRHPHVKLHLYGKQEARAGRKMGHYTCVGENMKDVLTLALKIQNELTSTR
ncbi:MAG: 5-(carboxyamino)imidazole ribonucleotide synthase [Candidatus Nitrotoga sp.]